MKDLFGVAKLYSAMAFAETNRLFDRLEQIYALLPETGCKMCGTCCTDPPPAALIEYLNIYRYIRDQLQARQQQLLEKTVAFFYLELVEPEQRCPFLDESNLCLIYPVRPFACRVYGLLSDDKAPLRRDGEALVRLAEKYRDEYGIVLPEAVIKREIPPCRDIEVTKGKKLSARKAESFLTALLMLDAQIVNPELVLERLTMLPVPLHLAITVLNDGLRARRLEVMKAYLETGSRALVDKYSRRVAGFRF
ncbi:MAG: YkgJ family cysteine cluster protein [Desulfotomaculales bacterium]